MANFLTSTMIKRAPVIVAKYLLSSKQIIARKSAFKMTCENDTKSYRYLSLKVLCHHGVDWAYRYLSASSRPYLRAEIMWGKRSLWARKFVDCYTICCVENATPFCVRWEPTSRPVGKKGWHGWRKIGFDWAEEGNESNMRKLSKGIGQMISQKRDPIERNPSAL